jgi:hypothetical protein
VAENANGRLHRDLDLVSFPQGAAQGMATTNRKPKGLRKIPGEMIAKAQDETVVSITRIMLTFVSVALFCLLALLTPDAALLTGGERLTIPLAGPVSFLGFILVGPAVLITLRVYLQIYIEHWRRLEPIRYRLAEVRAPTLAPPQNFLLKGFAGFVVYLLLPLIMLAFTWKAAILPALGSGLLCVTAAVTAGHLMLPVRWPWRSRVVLSMGVMLLIAVATYYGSRAVRRPPDLFGADLSDQYLPGMDLRGANLRRTNFQGANLYAAKLQGAWVDNANLQCVDLGAADLRWAYLEGTNLQGADLSDANLGEADLRAANLQGAKLLDVRGLTQEQLNQACGDEKTMLPLGFTIKACEGESSEGQGSSGGRRNRSCPRRTFAIRKARSRENRRLGLATTCATASGERTSPTANKH